MSLNRKACKWLPSLRSFPQGEEADINAEINPASPSPSGLCLSRKSTIRLRQKLVPDTVHGQKVLWARWVYFQFLAQFQHVVINGACARIVVVTPGLIE